jgi:hypothetical protein
MTLTDHNHVKEYNKHYLKLTKKGKPRPMSIISPERNVKDDSLKTNGQRSIERQIKSGLRLI